MASKDGWPRAGRTPAQTPAGRCPVPRRHLKKLGAAASKAAVTQGRTRAGRAPDARDIAQTLESQTVPGLGAAIWQPASFVLEIPRGEARTIRGGFHIGRIICGSTG
jgi:hypothetical protein